MELDRIDRKILNALQLNNKLTMDELGAVAGISPTACQRRVKRLRDDKVIEGDVSLVSPEAIGRPLMMLVSIDLERDRADIIDRFKQAIRRTPEIMSAYFVTGNADFMLIISVKDLQEYDAFTRRFFYENNDVRGFSTMVVMDRTKSSLAVPIDVERA
ncbi:Uncharacterized HTH-type transcriptional regulator y4tD [Mesorhizobium metallidurans STM 2683]|uniref:Uncharacterized HTH-type transcriptional regulator y4tD n=1 Tax=Mesorhizobium metallidurans STM 2683 TaxID=1297569 RepID=M5EYX3_9HYPH|nr:Lrp/AsnC family transcriptional regulator [Mesorhizobium metallidurans]CCV09263.1 Uncharacterized HTH-type transcriptional regulator y4tD [Mesorhizobium metallidurans STM 2683]